MSVDNTGARRNTNKVNAIALAKIGVAVFPSSGKVPLVPRFNKLDTEITPEDRDLAIEKFREEHDGASPVHVGATKDPETVKRMWRAHRDAVVSVACGPSGLVVLDADTKDNGPELMDALFKENGGVPEGVFVSTSRSGGKHYVFADPDSAFTNKAGLLKKNYGTDVRGTGGQFVAPGSVREDGKTYGTRADLAAFCRAITSKKIPQLPSFVTDLIGTSSGDPGTEHEQVAPSQEREVVLRLQDADWPEFEDIFDGTLGKYDLDIVKQDPDFAALYDEPSSDCSTNRFLAARALMRQWPDMAPEELAIFFEHWAEGAGSITDEKPKTGEYDLRQIAREWIKNQGLSKPSDGGAFGVVEEDVDEKTAYLANGGSDERWDAWQDNLACQREERLARLERQRLHAEVREDDDAKLEDVQPIGETRSKFAYIEDIRKEETRHLDWCVKFFIARGTTSIVSGLWGAGKTAVFSDIALHVAHGIPYRDRKVKKGVVVYVALENPEDVERRVRAWCETLDRAGHDVSNGAFVIHRGPCGLYRADGKPTVDEKELIKIAKEAGVHYGLPVAMIVIDTLSQSISPGNDREHGGIFVGAMQRISVLTGANVTSLHHPTKAGEAVRGDGQLQGNVDTVIDVSRDRKTGRGTIEAGSKFRIGDPSKVRFGYRLKAVEIGRDEDGDIIDVVLATEDHDPSFAVADGEDDDVPPLKVPDGREDRVYMLLDVARDEARKAAAEGEPLSSVALSAGTLRTALNAARGQFWGLNGQPLAELNREGIKRVIDTAVTEGALKTFRGRYFVAE